MKFRYWLRFSIDGDLRFISHRDTMRMCERALVRSELPVKYSEGFNPRVRLSLPLPRSVGTAGLDETLVFEVTEKLDTQDALARVREQMPADLRVRSLHLVESAELPRPVRAWYEIAFGGGVGGPERQALAQTVERFRRSETWPIERATPGRRGSKVVRAVDLRPLVEQLEIEADCLRMVLPVTPSGAARPREVLNALGLPAERWAHRLRRTRVDWVPGLPS